MSKRKEKLPCMSLILLLLLSIAPVFIVPASASETTKLYVDPPSFIDPALTPPKTFTINIIVADVIDLYGYAFTLGYDTTILDIVDVSTPKVLNPPTMVLKNETNEAEGKFGFAISCMGEVVTKNGTFTLAIIKFEVTGIGSCALDLYETGLSNSIGGPIEHSVEDGYFDNRSPPLPALILVDPPRIVNLSLFPCENFRINVSIIDASYLYSFEFKLGFDPNLLNATDAVLGDLFPPVTPTVEINNTAGYIWFSASLEPPEPEVSGNGTLAIITFHVERLGACRLTLYDTVLADKTGGPLPHTTSDGYFNNVLLARIFVDPPSIIDPTLLPPRIFAVNISIANVTDMYDYVFKLGYDTDLLNCIGLDINPFNNEIHFIPLVSVNDAAGIIYVNVTYFAPAVPITTTPPVAFVTIKFQVTGLGSTVLDLYDTYISDPGGALIPHEATDGYFVNIIRDVAILSVEPSTNATYSGWLVNITVVAGNEGDIAETFNVSAYYDNNLIETQTVTNLPPGENKTLIFTWNTAGLQPCTSYTIKAEADVVPYETDTADNVKIDGKVKIKIMGDIDGDGDVDLYDVVVVALAFGSKKVDDPRTPWDETAKWDPRADLKVNGVVDLFDVVTVAIRYGTSC